METGKQRGTQMQKMEAYFKLLLGLESKVEQDIREPSIIALGSLQSYLVTRQKTVERRGA